MIVLAGTITPRLRYILDFIGNNLVDEQIEVTTDTSSFRQYNGPKINYTKERQAQEEFFLPPHGLLSEVGISAQQIDCFFHNGYKAFFSTSGDMPFDVFAASFYLLSRYEEYLPYEKDEYGRYGHTNSLAWREKFLDQPLVNTWLQEFKMALAQRFPSLAFRNPAFTFIPTYDIDIAWSYLHKGWWRSTGALLRCFFKGDFKGISERFRVWFGRQRDPFDAYDWLHELHGNYQLKPQYFFLVSRRTGKYDKNIAPQKPSMQRLIKEHAAKYPVGIHPSWRSGDEQDLLKKEIAELAGIKGCRIYSSRQHYIRFLLPEGYLRLEQEGIEFDFSMGYGTINGFRASIATPFFWYDLKREQATRLLVFPFCYMEANSYYEQKVTATEALEEMRHYYRVTRAVNGIYIMIWHNSFLGTDRKVQEWKKAYETFIKQINS